MQFSVTSGELNGIIQTCELLLDVGDAGISGNATLLKQFTNLLNKSYDNVVAQILQNEGDYTWDDYSYTSSFPVATTTLVANQSDYLFPVAGSPGATTAASFLRLIKVMVKDANGNYQSLQLITETMMEQPLETAFATAGFPRFYKPLGNSIFLYPAPATGSVTMATGLKMYFQRDKVEFASTGADTKEPGFPSIYHYLLPLEMSETWAAIKGMSQLQFIQIKKAEFTKNLGWGVANMNKNQRQRITPVRRAFNNSYE